MVINITIQRKDLYLIGAIFVFLIGAGFVIAYGGNNPAVVGHSLNEIEGAVRAESGSFTMSSGQNKTSVTFSTPFKSTPLIKIYHNIVPGISGISGYNDFETGSENTGSGYSGIFIYNVTSTGFSVNKNAMWYLFNANIQWIAVGSN